jgi:3-oxoacyl-[acyl-carrier protein] reductase
MASEVHGEVVWIIGGSSGIGFAIAMAFAEQGMPYSIAISGRNEENLRGAASRIEVATGHRVFAARCDVTKGDDVRFTAAGIADHFGCEISILIHCAGISPFTTFTEASLEEFDEVMKVNLKGAFLCTKAVVPAMYSRHRGTIVMMLSIASEKAFKGGAAYVASKFALRGFTDSLREEARKQGVRVIGMLPGAVETELWGADERAKYHERMMQPEDIAKAVLVAVQTEARALVEEIRMRPIGGDL